MARTAKTVEHKVTREMSQTISGEIKSAVDSILAKHGLVAGKMATGFGEFYDFKITAYANEIGRNGVNLASKESLLFPAFGAMHGLTADDLGCEFTHMGQRWVLVGAKNSAKLPIVARRVEDGRLYALPESNLVIAAIKAAR
jgi:hypothetical protein